MSENSQRYVRPGAIERWFGRVLGILVRLGLVRGHFYLLEVRGRKSGKTISLPVDMLDIDSRRYLVCPRGEAQWVRNVRAAGTVTLVRGRRRRQYAAIELPLETRPALLKAYLDRFAAEVRRFLPVPKGSPVEAFNDIASRYPVFELRPRKRTHMGVARQCRDRAMLVPCESGDGDHAA